MIEKHFDDFHFFDQDRSRATQSLPQPQASALGMHLRSGGRDEAVTNDGGRHPLVGGQENDILAPSMILFSYAVFV